MEENRDIEEITKQLGPIYKIKKGKREIVVNFRGEEYKVKYSVIKKYGLKITSDEIKRHFSFY